MDLIKRFVTASNAGGLDDRTAEEIADRWFALGEDRLDLWRKDYKRVRRALSARHAARFVQVENQISLYVDRAVASEIPMIGRAGSAQ